MRRRADFASPPGRGFLLPAVLGLLLVVALLGLHAASGLASATTLSGNRALNQRAFEAAERGLTAMRIRLEAGDIPAEFPVTLASDALPTERAVLRYQQTARLTLPPGFSSGRFIEHRSQLQSQGRITRDSQARLTEGLSRILPEDEP